MAKEFVMHTCGHRTTTDIKGTSAERTRKVEWMETFACPECRNAAKVDEAAALANETGLPDLTGSEKQVTWALSLRADTIKDLDKTLEQEESRFAKIFANPELTEANREIFQDRLNTFRRRIGEIRADWLPRTEASWWINNRGDLAVKSEMTRRKENEAVA